MARNPSLPSSDQRTVDKLLAADLNGLTLEERNHVLEELHGVDDIVPETPEFVQNALAAMDMALDQIRDKPAYDYAKMANPVYLQDAKFRIMFLRATSFHPERAARRLVNFLQAKQRFFGNHTLTRSLHLFDLDRDSMEFFKSGIHQILPERSQSGKLMVTTCPRVIARVYENPDRAVKTFLYLMSTHAETDEESQKRGYIHVAHFTGRTMNAIVRDALMRMGYTAEMVPLRVTGIHFCAQQPNFFNKITRFVIQSISKTSRLHLRFHPGSSTEWQYSLLSFGIPVNQIPVGTGFELKTAAHLKWIAKQKVRDQTLLRGGHFDGRDLPGIQDVLYGRGKNFQDHPGNVRLRNFIASRRNEFQNGSRAERIQLIEQIMQEVGGSFLARNKHGWFEPVSNIVVFEKIELSFQKLLTSKKKKVQKRQDDDRDVAPMKTGKRTKLCLAENVCDQGCL